MKFKDYFKIFLKTFFLQSGWNFMRFQNFGLIFILSQRLKEIHKDENDLKEAYIRHLAIFNTQPYMASFVIGNILAMEEKIKTISVDRLIEIKQSLACAYASLGDRLFWSRLRISVLLSTIILYLIFSFISSFKQLANIEIIFLSLLIPTFFYASFTIYIRWKGLKIGYTSNDDNLCGLNFLNWNKIIKNLSFFNLLLFLIVIFIFLILVLGYRLGFSKSNFIFSIEFLFVSLAIIGQRFFKTHKKNISFTLIFSVLFAFLFQIILNLKGKL